MSYQEKEKALRIMEALSGVDETLLARCEDSGVKTAPAGTGDTKKVIPFYKYTKAMAACVACIVLGAGLLAAHGLVNWNGMMKSDNSAESMQGIAAEGMMNADSTKQEAQSPAEDAVLGDVALENAYESGNKHIPGEMAGLDGAGNSNGLEIEAGVESDGCPVDNRGILTLEEARMQDVVGAYIPQAIPDGYVVESALGSALGADTKEVTICWSRGMDTIRLRVTDEYVSRTDSSELAKRLVDPNATETYNVHLYEIPYAETVPAEYRELFDAPVFRAEDMTKELVEARMKVVADAGDTDTPRGNFAVLYENGILVEINADATPEQVWEMYLSIEP